MLLSKLHLWQAKEIKAQSEEFMHLSTLIERQQTILVKVQEKKSSITEMPHPQHSPTWFEELHKKAFKILPSTVNARSGVGIKYIFRVLQNIPVAGNAFLKMR